MHNIPCLFEGIWWIFWGAGGGLKFIWVFTENLLISIMFVWIVYHAKFDIEVIVAISIRYGAFFHHFRSLRWSVPIHLHWTVLLNSLFGLFVKELLSRSALETEKLELLTEISSLKLKLAAAEGDRRESTVSNFFHTITTTNIPGVQLHGSKKCPKIKRKLKSASNSEEVTDRMFIKIRPAYYGMTILWFPSWFSLLVRVRVPELFPVIKFCAHLRPDYSGPIQLSLTCISQWGVSALITRNPLQTWRMGWVSFMLDTNIDVMFKCTI